jgi:hypothetical protein
MATSCKSTYLAQSSRNLSASITTGKASRTCGYTTSGIPTPVPQVRAAREHYRTKYGDLNATVDSMMWAGAASVVVW